MLCSRHYSQEVDGTKMAGSVLVVLWALLSYLSCIESAEDGVKLERIQVQLPVSTYTSLMPQPIFYHTVIPVLYKFNLPSVSTYSSLYSALCEKDDEEMSSRVVLSSQVSVMSSSNCSTDDGESTPPKTTTTTSPPKPEESIACSTLKQLSQVFDEMMITHQPWKPSPLHSIFSSTHSPLSLVPCDEVSVHFQSFKLSSEEFPNYLARLKECNFGENVSMIMEPILEERIDFQQLFMSAHNTTRRYERSAGEDFNVVVAMQQASISHLQLERSKWFEAFSDCRSHLIPITLIDFNSLTRALELLKPKQHFQLAVKNLRGYYNLPLSDCAVLEEAATTNSFLVRVLIPVVKFNHNVHLVKATSIPAVKLVRNDMVELCDSLSGDLLLSGGDDVIVSKACQSNKLCHLDGSERKEWVPKHCLFASKILPASESDGNCTTQCYRLPTDHLPLIRRSGSNKFLVIATTLNSTSVEISCNSNASPVLIDLIGNSTAELVLPCECEIRTGILQRAVSPCKQNGAIRVIYFESSLSTTRQKDKNYSHYNHGEIPAAQDQMTKFMYKLESLKNDDDIRQQDVQQQVYYLWAIVLALTSSVILSIIIILICFSLRIKRMRRDFIKSNDHRSTFYSFTDMAVV